MVRQGFPDTLACIHEVMPVEIRLEPTDIEIDRNRTGRAGTSKIDERNEFCRGRLGHTFSEYIGMVYRQ